MGFELGSASVRLGVGLAASVIGHGTILLVALTVLAHPRSVESASPTITVDLVSQDETTPKPDPTIDLPADAAEPAAKPAAALPKTTAAPQETTAPAADSAPPERQAADPQPNPLASAATGPAIADPFAPNGGATPLYIPYLQGLDSAESDYSFDAPADTSAKLSREEIATFQAHLQKCWKPPAGGSDADKLRAVLRVTLDRHGAITGEPQLVSASASAEGPRLVQAAMRALRQCQPFTFLPADRYDEWRLLDLSFSAHGLAGG